MKVMAAKKEFKLKLKKVLVKAIDELFISFSL
jgi:hypothetical protein